MEHLEHPPAQFWAERRAWFEQLAEPQSEWAGYTVSEQASAIAAEVQACFCAGAWVAVMILVAAAIDAQLREDSMPGFKGGSKALISTIGLDDRYDRLRQLRNALVHVDPDSPSLTVNNQWSDRSSLEIPARGAVEMMFETFWMNPWI